MKYAHVVFIQGSEADEPHEILMNQGLESLFNYLQQWDCGEYHDLRDEPSAGQSDTTIRIYDYIITINNRMPYYARKSVI